MDFIISHAFTNDKTVPQRCFDNDLRTPPVPLLYLTFSKKKPKWNRLAEMPTRRAGANGGLVENRLVLIGGIDETRRPHEVVDAYDVKTKSWSTLEPISEPRQGIATLVRSV